MKKYLLRKNQELDLLAKSINKNTKYKCKNIENVLTEKENLVKKMREHSTKKYYHNLTNKVQQKFENDILNYSYTYERFNGFVDVKNFVNTFYSLPNNLITKNYFSNSGMSAITSLLSSLILANDINVDMLYEETYFETIKYINMCNKNKSKLKMLYVDSIASNFSFKIDEINIDKYIGVIIDTTCFEAKKFEKMIQYIIKQNKLCILVRSHTKLDMLCTEFSHIGSVSFVYNDVIYKSYSTLIDSIADVCRHLIGVYGACLPPERFPEFMLNEEIKKLNETRILEVEKNNDHFYNFLKKYNYKIEIPSHKQFCLLYFQNSEITLEGMKNKITAFCNKNILPVFHAVSFGFDYIALDCYQNYIDKTYKIRICISDLPFEVLKNFEKEFKLFLLDENIK